MGTLNSVDLDQFYRPYRDETTQVAFDLVDCIARLAALVPKPRVNITKRGCGVKLGLVYAVNPRLSRYSMGLSEPREILMRFSLYQRI